MTGSRTCPSKLLIIKVDQKEQWKDWLQSFKQCAAAIQLDKSDIKVLVSNSFHDLDWYEAQQIFKTFVLSEEEE